METPTVNLYLELSVVIYFMGFKVPTSSDKLPFIYSIIYRCRIDIVDIYRWLGARCINNQMLSWVPAAGSSGRQASLSACDRRRRYRVAGRHARGVRQCCTLLMEATHYQFLLTKSFHTLWVFWRFLPNKCFNKLKLELGSQVCKDQSGQSDELCGQASQSILVMSSSHLSLWVLYNIVKHRETWLACLRVVASVDSESADHRLQSAATQPHHFLLPAPPHAAATHTEHGPGYT